MPSSARGVESSGNLYVVKTESELLNLGHETLHYEKPNSYNIHCFGCCHDGYGGTH
jgi:hypothetical protein